MLSKFHAKYVPPLRYRYFVIVHAYIFIEIIVYEL